jgi:hypothetical protein
MRLPDRADCQRDLSVSYNKMGDLYRDLGQGEAARKFYLKDLAIAERLAAAEPDRADYQRDLIVSLVRQAQMADGPAAREHLQRALGILEELQSGGGSAQRMPEWRLRCGRCWTHCRSDRAAQLPPRRACGLLPGRR